MLREVRFLCEIEEPYVPQHFYIQYIYEESVILILVLHFKTTFSNFEEFFYIFFFIMWSAIILLKL